MKIITIASPKGGSGKSTLTQCLAVAAIESGATAMIIDMDPQIDSMSWCNDRAEILGIEKMITALAARTSDDVRDGIERAEEIDADYVFIDTPPVYQGPKRHRRCLRDVRSRYHAISAFWQRSARNCVDQQKAVTKGCQTRSLDVRVTY